MSQQCKIGMVMFSLVALTACLLPTFCRAGNHGKLTVVNKTEEDISVSAGNALVQVVKAGTTMVFEPNNDSVTNTEMKGRGLTTGTDWFDVDIGNTVRAKWTLFPGGETRFE